MNINKISEYAALYDQLGLGQDTGNTNSMGWVMPSRGYDRNAARAHWAENMAKNDRQMPNFFASMFGGNHAGNLPQFNTPMPNNPYSQRVDRFAQPDPLQGQARNYLAQMFQQPSTPTGYRLG